MSFQTKKISTFSSSSTGGGGSGSLRIGRSGSSGGSSMRSISNIGNFRSSGGGSTFSSKRSSGGGFARSSSGGGGGLGGGLQQRRALSQYSMGSARQISHARGIGQQSCIDINVPIPANDTTQQAVRVLETKQITSLNNQFANFIGTVRALEERNTQLKVQLSLMQQQGSFSSSIDKMFEAYIQNLKQQLEALGQEKLKFEMELVQMQGLVEDFKTKYEDEINKRTEVENEFVMVKKDVDESYMNKVELEAKLERLSDELDFLKAIFQAEIDELQTQVQNTCVNVQIASRAQIDMQGMIEEIQNQYKRMADQSRQECARWKESKMQELSMSGGTGDDMRIIKSECNDLMSNIRRLTMDIENLKKQRAALEAACTEAEERGELSLKDSKLRIQQLQEAIQKAKNELTIRAREMEELLSVKLALDIEIATYRKLLEGEEQRLTDGIQTISIQQSTQSGAGGGGGGGGRFGKSYGSSYGGMETSSYSSSSTKSPLVVKMIEESDGVTISTSFNKVA
ncbi:keratin, type II cytoskeletal 8-like [Leucoraja erinacea]|uniref:keratin, type II cytoskeletal 8-like n=1 Tax=Leucoraja erinaceus TaxID=7782 RepID=UPI002456F600|nr:keratin, type II cytoskeletal 8-like [Leucoraja erinacea]